jgi:hypothetical protein
VTRGTIVFPDGVRMRTITLQVREKLLVWQSTI